MTTKTATEVQYTRPTTQNQIFGAEGLQLQIIVVEFGEFSKTFKFSEFLRTQNPFEYFSKYF